MSNDPTSRELIEGFIDGTLDEARLSELKHLLQADPALRASMTMELRLRGLLRAKRNDSSGLGDSVAAAIDGFSPQRHEDAIIDAIHPKAAPSTIPFRSTPKTTHRLARAAAWLGAFTWLGNKAQAAGAVSTTTTLLMTKTTTTAITAAILLAGGGSLYLIHQSNEQATARVEQLEARQDAAPHEATAGRSTSRPVATTLSTDSIKATAEPTSKSNKEILRKISGFYGKNLSSSEILELRELRTMLESMDEQKLKGVLLEAEQMNDLEPYMMSYLLNILSEKSPADATLSGTKLLANDTGFNEDLSDSIADAFGAWMTSDPAAADKWYHAAMASGELTPKSIPKAGRERYLPERLLAMRRFSILLKSDAEQAVAMVKGMVPADAAERLMWCYDTELVARIAAQLPPELQYHATVTRARNIASSDFKQAAEWVSALEVTELVRGNLLAQAARTAHHDGKLSRLEALEIINGLPVTPEREEARRAVESK